MRKYQLVLILALFLLVLSMALTLFVWLESPRTERILIDTSTLKVTQEGGIIAVTDVLSGKQYCFTIRYKCPSEANTKAVTVSDDGANIVVKVAEKRIEILDDLNNKKYVLRIGKIFPKVYKSTFNFMKKGGEKIEKSH